MLYSHNGGMPAPLPDRIILANGESRTDREQFTPGEIEGAGYKPAPDRPNYNSATQHPPEWDGAKWTVRNKSAEEIAAALAARKSDALAALAQRRWEHETGGINFNGVPIRTDEVGQAKITGALALFANDPAMTTIDWEAQPGVWATLDLATIKAIGVAVGRHVQSCFSRARVISEAIQAAASASELDVAQAEIEVGWPG